MWQREVINQQTFLNTQNTVYEVLTKTPEEVLCKSADAVKIDMMIKAAANAEPDAQYGVRFVPYRDVSTGIVIDPNASSKNYSRNVALAIAFIAADRDDWHRFIPIGMRTLALDAKKKREAEIVAKQNRPFHKQKAPADSDDEFSDVSSRDDNADDDDEVEKDEKDDDEDVDDKLLVFDNAAHKFVPATKQEEDEFTHAMSGKEKTAPKENEDHTEELLQRLTRLRLEQEQQTREAASTLPSDRLRRQAASLNDPQCEANLSEITQRFAAASAFDLKQERQATREKEFGIKASEAKQTQDVLQRFAPSPAVRQPPAVSGKTMPPKPPQYTVQELMQIASKTPLPSSIQQQIERNKNPEQQQQQQQQQQNQQQQQQNQQQQQQQQQAQMGQVHTGQVHMLQAKLKLIRRKQLELMQLLADLEDCL